MENSFVGNERLKKINKLKIFLKEFDDELLSIAKELDWDYEKLVNEVPLNMVTCSVNAQHKIPETKICLHEEKCSWHQKGYKDDDKSFSEHSGSGSFVILTSELIESLTANIPSLSEKKNQRSIPQTSANLDQNFNREEKLKMYDYVIGNTEKQISFSDLCLQPEKKVKKEMTSWEIAAAERDAKRRRASYRNKVHINRKTYTEILREVITVHMEALVEENTIQNKLKKKVDKDNYDNTKHKHKSKYSEKEKKYSNRESPSRRNKERHKRKNRDNHFKHKDRSYKRSPLINESDSNSRSRFHDKYGKRKFYEGRPYFHNSSPTHNKRS